MWDEYLLWQISFGPGPDSGGLVGQGECGQIICSTYQWTHGQQAEQQLMPEMAITAQGKGVLRAVCRATAPRGTELTCDGETGTAGRLQDLLGKSQPCSTLLHPRGGATASCLHLASSLCRQIL